MTRTCFLNDCKHSTYKNCCSFILLRLDHPEAAVIVNDLGLNLADIKWPLTLCDCHFTKDSFISWGETKRLGKNPRVKKPDDPPDMTEINFLEFEAEASADKIESFNDLTQNFAQKLGPDLIDEFWTIGWAQNFSSMNFYHLFYDFEDGGKVQRSILINKNMLIKVQFNGKILPIMGSLGSKLKNWSQLANLLNTVRYMLDNNAASVSPEEVIQTCISQLDSVLIFAEKEQQKRLKLIVCQLSNLLSKSISGRRYCPETLLMAFLIKNISTAGYEVLQEFFSLPSVRWMRQLSERLDCMNNEKYFRYLVNRLTPSQRYVCLQIDEIYIEEKVNFKSEEVFGFAQIGNDSSEIAKTIQAFMIESPFASYHEIVKLLPAATQNATDFMKEAMQVVKFVQSIGFIVVCIISDNSKLNQGLFKLLTTGADCQLNESFPNSDHLGHRIFVKYDTVHIFKNIRNNWLTRKDNEKSFFYPCWGEIDDPIPSFLTASFETVRTYYKLNMDKHLRTGCRLSEKVCFPEATFLKQNVSLCDDLFHDSTIGALKSELHCFETAAFMQIIRDWWDISNVKSKFKVNRTLKPFHKTFMREDQDFDDKIRWLHKFIDWLDLWFRQGDKSRCLTADTYGALRQSTSVMIKLVSYLFVKCPEVDYVMSGKFQTDPLEKRFGKYRQLHGGSYKLTEVQVREAEKKCRERSILFFALNSEGSIPVLPDVDDTDEDLDTSLACAGALLVYNDYLELNDASRYVAGVCARRTIKSIANSKTHEVCLTCRKVLEVTENRGALFGSAFEQHMQHGGLLEPSEEFSVTLVKIGVAVLEAIVDNQDLLSDFIKPGTKQGKILTYLITEASKNHEMDPSFRCPSCERLLSDLIHKFCSPLSKTLLVGFCKKTNNISQHTQRLKNQRKFAEKRRNSFDLSDLQNCNAFSIEEDDNSQQKRRKTDRYPGKGAPLSRKYKTLNIEK